MTSDPYIYGAKSCDPSPCHGIPVEAGYHSSLVSNELNELAYTVSSILDTVGRLEDRLAPVLLVDPPLNDNCKNVMGKDVTLLPIVVAQVREYRENLHSVEGRLREVIRKLAI